LRKTHGAGEFALVSISLARCRQRGATQEVFWATVIQRRASIVITTPADCERLAKTGESGLI
jgi:hypothetical protein